MLEAVTMLLQGTCGGASIPTASEIRANNFTVDAAKTELTQLLLPIAKMVGSDDNSKILFHLDEHRKMTGDGNSAMKTAFRRGAMELLARNGDVTVMATYTEALQDLKPAESGGVCGIPAATPSLGINALMDYTPELQFPTLASSLKKREVKRAWANYKLLLTFFSMQEWAAFIPKRMT